MIEESSSLMQVKIFGGIMINKRMLRNVAGGVETTVETDLTANQIDLDDRTVYEEKHTNKQDVSVESKNITEKKRFF